MSDIKQGDRVRHELMREGVVASRGNRNDWLVDFDNGLHNYCDPSSLTLIEPQPEPGFEVGDTVTANGVTIKVAKISGVSADRCRIFAANGARWGHFYDPLNIWHFTKVEPEPKPTTFTVSKEISVAEYEAHVSQGIHRNPMIACNLFQVADVDAAYREQVGE